MANDPRYGARPFTPFQSRFSTLEGADGQVNANNRLLADAAAADQQYARDSGPGTRYEQEQAALRQQMQADQRERDQYQQWLSLGRADGLAPTEQGRQFDARMNVLAQILGQGSARAPLPGIGMPMPQGQGAMAPDGIDRPGINNVLSRYLKGAF